MLSDQQLDEIIASKGMKPYNPATSNTGTSGLRGRALLDSLKQRSAQQTTDQQPVTGVIETQQDKPDGFFKGLAKSIVKPFAETATTGYNTLAATGKLLSGDTEGANKALETKRDLPFMGVTKPSFTGQEGFGDGVKKMAGYGAEMASNFIGGGGVGTLAKNTVGGLVKQGVKQAVKTGALSGGIGQLGSSLQDEDSSVGDTALSTAAGTLGGGLVGGVLSVPSTLVGAGIKKLFTPIEQKVREAISEAVGKGIRPSVAGKGTASLQNGYLDDAQEAFHTIAQFKPKFTDDGGNEVVRNPKTRKELLDSIGQVKRKVYDLYDGLKKSAGEAGARVDTAPIVRELRAAADNPDVMLNKPEIAKTLTERADMYEQKGVLSAQEAQQLVEGINSRLQSFYRNPNYNEASNAAIDALISSNVRKGLDDVVTSLTGAEYQPLRNKYKALSSIEKDVAKQVVVESRKVEKGLIDFTDILTAGDLVRGIVTLNPADIAKGTLSRALKEVYKKLNDPNRYIARAFDALDKLPPESIPQPKNFSPAGLLGEGAMRMPERSPSTILKELEESGVDSEKLDELRKFFQQQSRDNTLRLPAPDPSRSGPTIDVFPNDKKGVDYVGDKTVVGDYERPQTYPTPPTGQTKKFYERQSKAVSEKPEKKLQAIEGKKFRRIIEGTVVK